MMKREEFFGKKDTLQTQIEIPDNAKSVIVRFGDKYGDYEINGVVEYSDGEKWYKLKEYRNFKRTAPYICLTVNPEYHKTVRFNLSLSGGKFKDVYTSSESCTKKEKEIKKEIEEGRKDKKGFLEQITDLIKAYTTLLIVLLIIAVLGFIVFLKFLKFGVLKL